MVREYTKVIKLYDTSYYEERNRLFDQFNSIRSGYAQYLKEVEVVVMEDIRATLAGPSNGDRKSLTALDTIKAPKTPGMTRKGKTRKKAKHKRGSSIINICSPNTSIVQTPDCATPPSTSTDTGSIMTPNRSQPCFKGKGKGKRLRSLLESHQKSVNVTPIKTTPIRMTRLQMRALENSPMSVNSSVCTTASTQSTRSTRNRPNNRIQGSVGEVTPVNETDGPINSTMCMPNTPTAPFSSNITMIENTHTPLTDTPVHTPLTDVKKTRFVSEEDEIIVSSPIGPITTLATPTHNSNTNLQHEVTEAGWRISTGKGKSKPNEAAHLHEDPNRTTEIPVSTPQHSGVSTPQHSGILKKLNVTHQPSPAPVPTPIQRQPVLLSETARNSPPTTQQTPPTSQQTPPTSHPTPPTSKQTPAASLTFSASQLTPQERTMESSATAFDENDIVMTPEMVAVNKYTLTPRPDVKPKIRFPVIESTLDEEDEEREEEEEICPRLGGICEEEEEEEEEVEVKKQENCIVLDQPDTQQLTDVTEEKYVDAIEEIIENRDVSMNEVDGHSDVKEDEEAAVAVEEPDSVDNEDVMKVDEPATETTEQSTAEQEVTEAGWTINTEEDKSEPNVETVSSEITDRLCTPCEDVEIVSAEVSEESDRLNICEQSDELFSADDKTVESEKENEPCTNNILSPAEDAMSQECVETAEDVMSQECVETAEEKPTLDEIMSVVEQEVLVTTPVDKQMRKTRSAHKIVDVPAPEPEEKPARKTRSANKKTEKVADKPEVKEGKASTSRSSQRNVKQKEKSPVRHTRSSRNRKVSQKAEPVSSGEEEEFHTPSKDKTPSLPKQGTVKKLVKKYESPKKYESAKKPVRAAAGTHDMSVKRDRETDTETEITTSHDDTVQLPKKQKGNTGNSQNPPNLMTSMFSLVNRPTVIVKTAKELEEEKKESARQKIKEKEDKYQQTVLRKKQRENELRLKRIEKEKRMKKAKENKEEETKKKKLDLEKKMRIKEETAAKERELVAKREEEKRQKEIKKAEQAEQRRKQVEKAREVKKRKLQEDMEERKQDASRRKQELEAQRVRELEKHRQEEEHRLEEQRRTQAEEHSKRVRADQARRKHEEECKKTPVKTPTRKLNNTATVGVLLQSDTPPRPPRAVKQTASKIPTKIPTKVEEHTKVAPKVTESKVAEIKATILVENKATIVVENKATVVVESIREKGSVACSDSAFTANNMRTPQVQKDEHQTTPTSQAKDRLQSYMKSKLQSLGNSKKPSKLGSKLGAINEDNTAVERPTYDPRDNYKIDDIDSGDETDEESNPQRTIPLWASSKAGLTRSLEAQFLGDATWKVDDIFAPYPQTVDLDELFGTSNKYKSRTSSAHWETAPTTGSLDFSMLTEDEVTHANKIAMKYNKPTPSKTKL